MALQTYLILSLLFLANLLAFCELSVAAKDSFSRKSFPAGFLFGSSSSAYGFEGAAKEDGKGPSIWDTYTNQHPERILDATNGNIAADFYHRYKDDIKLMKDMGLDTFGFSISWSRVLPYGKLSKGVNKEGIAFYNNLINSLLAKGITPFVTLMHLDTPQALEDEYGGFLSPKIVKDFGDYADLCFKEFGDRVKHWLTFYEMWTFTSMGYDAGILAPGRCSPWMPTNCTHGNSGVEPYLVGHHLLLSHATAVKLYRQNHKGSQKGQIGIKAVSNWVLPYDKKSIADAKAAKRVVNFVFGWVLHPVTYGKYPKIMRTLVGNRLPKFTKEESAMLKNSIDFLGVNYYSSNYAKDMPITNPQFLSYSTDAHANQTYVGPDGKLIGAATGLRDVHVYPEGLYHLLIHAKKKYKNPIIYITDNGLPEAPIGTDAQLINDTIRVDFHHRHLWEVKRAIKHGVRVKGYFIYAFLDDFEYFWGHIVRFGLNFVDYKNGLKRIPKLSARWFKNFLART